MKRLIFVLPICLLTSCLAFAAGLISKQVAEKDALHAVDSGTVLQAVLDSEAGKKVWSVDIAGSSQEYEVLVDAYSASILKIIKQPLDRSTLITKDQAEQDALAAVGGGEVLQAELERPGKDDKRDCLVNVLGSGEDFEVTVDAHTGEILKTVTQPEDSVARGHCRYITKAKAASGALEAVGGGTIISAVLETNDTPADWSVDLVSHTGAEYEVKVNACTGKVIAVIVGG